MIILSMLTIEIDVKEGDTPCVPPPQVSSYAADFPLYWFIVCASFLVKALLKCFAHLNMFFLFFFSG